MLFTLASYYRPPTSTMDTMTKLHDIISLLRPQCLSNSVLCGDFNVDPTGQTPPHLRALRDLQLDYNLTQVVLLDSYPPLHLLLTYSYQIQAPLRLTVYLHLLGLLTMPQFLSFWNFPHIRSVQGSLQNLSGFTTQPICLWLEISSLSYQLLPLERTLTYFGRNGKSPLFLQWSKLFPQTTFQSSLALLDHSRN